MLSGLLTTDCLWTRKISGRLRSREIGGRIADAAPHGGPGGRLRPEEERGGWGETLLPEEQPDVEHSVAVHVRWIAAAAGHRREGKLAVIFTLQLKTQIEFLTFL